MKKEMKKEMRLIDANALIAEYDRVHIGPPGGARKLMVDAPTVDAVEVVRCKDCKRYCKSAIGSDDCLLLCVDVKPDDYCSHGERKDNEI